MPAMATGSGTGPMLARPMATNGSGKPNTERASDSRYARPRRMAAMARVTMRGLILSARTRLPFRNPMAPPPTMPTQIARSGSWVSRATRPVTTAVRA